MKKIVIFLLFAPLAVFAQITDTDGDWSKKYELLFNTPEAELMSRTGDIDNLGFGWPIDFDPFSGYSTPPHAYPWVADTMDPTGTDRIMVISSYNGYPPYGQDGYTSGTSWPENQVTPITVGFPPSFDIDNATLQMFVDDFQAPVWGANYQVYLDGIRVIDLENIINLLVQTGPIGKMITYSIPDHLLYLLLDGELLIEFDDFTSGAGDGYAIDFVKLLINPTEGTIGNATITGTVLDCNTQAPISGVVLYTGNNQSSTTDISGNYTINNVTPGIVQVNTYKPGYGAQFQVIDIQQNETINLDFCLVSPAPILIYHEPYDTESSVELDRSIKLVFDQQMIPATFNASALILSDTVQNISGNFSINQDTLSFTPDSLQLNQVYQVEVTTNIKNMFGVGMAQNVIFTFDTNIPSSTEALENVQEFNVYPNPVRDELYVEYSGKAAGYLIINNKGEMVQKGKGYRKINLRSNFFPGLYYIVLTDDQNNWISQEKFIIQ